MARRFCPACSASRPVGVSIASNSTASRSGILGAGRRSPDRLALEIASCNLHTVEVGDEPVIIPHVEHQIRQIRQNILRNIEENSNIAGRAATIHRSGNVDAKQLLIARAALIADTSRAAGPAESSKAGLLFAQVGSIGIETRPRAWPHPPRPAATHRQHGRSRAAPESRGSLPSSVYQMVPSASRIAICFLC